MWAWTEHSLCDAVLAVLFSTVVLKLCAFESKATKLLLFRVGQGPAHRYVTCQREAALVQSTNTGQRLWNEQAVLGRVGGFCVSVSRGFRMS